MAGGATARPLHTWKSLETKRGGQAARPRAPASPPPHPPRCRSLAAAHRVPPAPLRSRCGGSASMEPWERPRPRHPAPANQRRPELPGGQWERDAPPCPAPWRGRAPPRPGGGGRASRRASRGNSTEMGPGARKTRVLLEEQQLSTTNTREGALGERGACSPYLGFNGGGLNCFHTPLLNASPKAAISRVSKQRKAQTLGSCSTNSEASYPRCVH